jgi:hypothetical protein
VIDATTTRIDEPPSLGERYGVATSTSDMRVLGPGQRSPADYIIAAGQVGAKEQKKHRLGILLLRLRAEHDGTASELQQADELARQRERQAAEVLKAARGAKDDEKGTIAQKLDAATYLAAAIRRRSAGEILAARYAVLSKLSTLDEAKQELGRFACRLATKRRYMKPDSVVVQLAGRVLDVHLDPICHHCDGTGLEGSGYRGEKTTPCKPCGGTAHRRTQLGNDDTARAFAWGLLLEIDRAMSQAAAAMRDSLSAR